MIGNIEIKEKLANSGRIIRVSRFANLVLDALKPQACHLLAGDFGSTGDRKWIDRMQFGTGVAAEAVTDEFLSQPITPIKDVTPSYPYDGLVNDYYVRFTVYLQADEANGFPISEMGLLAQDDTLVARKTFTPINKTVEYIIEFNWTLRS